MSSSRAISEVVIDAKILASLGTSNNPYSNINIETGSTTTTTSQMILVTNSAGSSTVTLNSTPADGEHVIVKRQGGGTLAVSPATKTIYGIVGNYTIPFVGKSAVLIFDQVLDSWVLDVDDRNLDIPIKTPFDNVIISSAQITQVGSYVAIATNTSGTQLVSLSTNPVNGDHVVIKNWADATVTVELQSGTIDGVAGNISLNPKGSYIEVYFSAIAGTWIILSESAIGEANTNTNAGTGAGLVLPKVGVDTPLKTLKTSGIATITSDADSVTIDVPIAAQPQQNTFDPATINRTALTNANLTVSPTSTIDNGLAYAAITPTNGVYDYEAAFTLITSTTASNIAVGAVSAIDPTRTEYLGFFANEFGVYPYTNRIDLYINDVVVSTATATLTSGDTINISLNVDTKVVEVSVNGGTTLITQSLAGMNAFIPAVNTLDPYGDITAQFDTVGGSEANTNSNAGAGAGLVLPKVGVDTPIKSLTSSDGSVTITENANEVDLAAVTTQPLTPHLTYVLEPTRDLPLNVVGDILNLGVHFNLVSGHRLFKPWPVVSSGALVTTSDFDSVTTLTVFFDIVLIWGGTSGSPWDFEIFLEDQLGNEIQLGVITTPASTNLTPQALTGSVTGIAFDHDATPTTYILKYRSPEAIRMAEGSSFKVVGS